MLVAVRRHQRHVVLERRAPEHRERRPQIVQRPTLRPRLQQRHRGRDAGHPLARPVDPDGPEELRRRGAHRAKRGRCSRFASRIASSRPVAASASGTSGFVEQRPQRRRTVPGRRGLDRQPLVRLGVLHEPEHVLAERRDRDRVRAVGVDPRGDLDDVVVGEVRDRPGVASVHDLHVARPGRERGDELRGGLAVERAAASLEQLRLLREIGIAVELEQVVLDLRDLLGARRPAGLAFEHLPGPVVVAQVVGGDRPERTEQLGRDLRLRAQLRQVGLEELGQAVDPVHLHRPDPGQVVQPDVLELHPLGLDPEALGEPPLEADRDVAQPDRPDLTVEQRLGHQAGRVREVDEPAPGRAAAPGELGELEHDRNGPQRLREPARPGGLLPDAPEPERDRLVEQPGGLAPDAQLHDHERRTVDRLVTIAGQDRAAAEPRPVEHPAGEATDDLQARGIDVQQRELVDGEPVGTPDEPLDQFGRVGAPGSDDRHLHTHRSASYTPGDEMVRKVS